MATRLAKHRKIDVTLATARNAGEAVNYIFIGLKFFLIHHTAKTVLVLLFMLSGPIYIAWDWYSSDRIKIKDAEPIQAHGANFKLMEEAVAAEPQNPNRIEINGKFYGYYDPNFVVYMMTDNERLFIYNKAIGRAVFINAPTMRSSKQLMK